MISMFPAGRYCEFNLTSIITQLSSLIRRLIIDHYLPVEERSSGIDEETRKCEFAGRGSSHRLSEAELMEQDASV